MASKFLDRIKGANLVRSRQPQEGMFPQVEQPPYRIRRTKLANPTDNRPAPTGPMYPFPWPILHLHNFFLSPTTETQGSPLEDFTAYPGGEPPQRRLRPFNPAVKGFKGAKNYGGPNNMDNLLLQRVVRYQPNAKTSRRAVQLGSGAAQWTQSTQAIASVFVPSAELR